MRRWGWRRRHKAKTCPCHPAVAMGKQKMGLLRKNCPVETTKHLTQAQVLDQLYYNPDMGTFLWRHGAKGRKAWDRAGYTRADGYVVLHIGGRYCYGHRLAWLYMHGEWPNGLIDHIDGNPSNNVLSNLRVATKRSNAENMKGPTSASSTGRLGVFKDTRSGKFVSQIRINGNRKSLGVFASVDAAYDAYLAAKRAFHSGSLL